MKPPPIRSNILKSPKPAAGPKGAPPVSDKVYAPPTPKVSRQTKAKVLSPAERAAFLASRPDLKPKG